MLGIENIDNERVQFEGARIYPQKLVDMVVNISLLKGVVNEQCYVLCTGVKEVAKETVGMKKGAI